MMQVPLTPDVAAKQKLRQSRFFMSAATYVAFGVLAQICAWMGYLPARLPAWWALGALVANGIFYLLLRSGWNLRLRDPSMTEAQLLVSIFAAMVLTYHADSVKSTFLIVLPVPLLFGVFRLRLMQMVRMGLIAIGSYASVIALLAYRQPERVQLGLEALNLVTLTTVIGFVCLMGGYLSRVRSELSRSLATIRETARRDALTGALNRRHLTETLELELARCTRHVRRGLVLCIADLDHFKRINDSFGHQAGDEVLIAVAKCLGDSIRNIDQLARYGGEEFVVLLDLETADDWIAVCERMRVNVSRIRLPALKDAEITISIGVAEYADGDTPTSLFARADQALYRAKSDGRNCVRRADPPA